MTPGAPAQRGGRYRSPIGRLILGFLFMGGFVAGSLTLRAGLAGPRPMLIAAFACLGGYFIALLR